MTHAFAFPRHAYLPGQTPRHPEEAFDAVKAEAPAVTRSAEAERNVTWRHGLQLFAAGFFWEAHEVLEPVWMNAPPNSAERHVVQGVIQLANAALKAKMGRAKAAERLAGLARELFERVPADAVVMGLPVDALRAAAERAPEMDWPEQAQAIERVLDKQYNAQYPPCHTKESMWKGEIS